MSALQLWIRLPLMRSCPGDPEEEEGGAAMRALDSTNRRGEVGEVRGQMCSTPPALKSFS